MAWRTGTVRYWLNLETFILCLGEVAAIKKVNLRWDVGGLNDPLCLLPGLEIAFISGQDPNIEIDYLKEDHRDQVFDAIGGEIKKFAISMGGDQ